MGSPLPSIIAKQFICQLEKQIWNRKYLHSHSNWGHIYDHEQGHRCKKNARGVQRRSPQYLIDPEREEEDKLAFLDLLLERKEKVSQERSVLRKKIWFEQYIPVQRLVPICSKRNLIRWLRERARRICSEKTLTSDTAFRKNKLSKKQHALRDLWRKTVQKTLQKYSSSQFQWSIFSSCCPWDSLSGNLLCSKPPHCIKSIDLSIVDLFYFPPVVVQIPIQLLTVYVNLDCSKRRSEKLLSNANRETFTIRNWPILCLLYSFIRDLVRSI